MVIFYSYVSLPEGNPPVYMYTEIQCVLTTEIRWARLPRIRRLTQVPPCDLHLGARIPILSGKRCWVDHIERKHRDRCIG